MNKNGSVSKKIIIAGGGTGGHIFPAVAIANALKKRQPDLEILFVGAKGKMEMEKIPQAGYEILGLDIAGFNRSSLIKNLRLPFKLIRSLVQVRSIFRLFRPDAVIGVGGYSSFPVLRYAQAKGIPTFIHESNSFAGKSNILLGKKATRIFVASDGMDQFFPADRIMVTGNPVRESIVRSDVTHEAALQFFSLNDRHKTVLIVGGSLGARSINEAIAQHLDEFVAKDIQLIWQTGKGFGSRAKDLGKGKPGIWTDAFITQMDQAYAAADLVVSRAGAMAIAELCVVGKPVVFVPYPFAAEDHQTKNAEMLVAKNAAVMVKDSAVKEELVPLIGRLLQNPEQIKVLATNISQLGVRDADTTVAAEILKAIYE